MACTLQMDVLSTGREFLIPPAELCRLAPEEARREAEKPFWKP